MPYKDYDRYEPLKNDDGTTDMMPFVEISVNVSDKYEYWNTSFSRMDKLSQKYYGQPFGDFLILYANNIYVSEFDIPDGALIRIPFPYIKAKTDYDEGLKNFKK
jgi:hypothetical protein